MGSTSHEHSYGQGERPKFLSRQEIMRGLRLLVPPGQVCELRILNATTADWPHRPYTASGYFDNHEAIFKALANVRSAQGVYFTLNPGDAALLARAQNRLRTPEEMRQARST